MKFSIFQHPHQLYRVAIRSPRLVLVVCFIFALFCLFWAQKLVVTDLYSGLLPEGTTSVQGLKYAQKSFGELGFLVVVISGNEASAVEQFAREFTSEIELKSDVYYVRTPWDFDFVNEYKWLYVDIKDLADIERRLDQALILQNQGVNFVFADLMDFADQDNLPDLRFKDIRDKYTKRWGAYLNFGGEIATHSGATELLLWIKSRDAKSDLAAKRKFVTDIKLLEQTVRRHFPDSEAISVGYTGAYQTQIETITKITREMVMISISVILLLIIVLIRYFKKPRLVFYVGIPLVTGIIWTGGLTWIALGKLNLLTGFAASIMAGLGIDYAIYLLTRFDQERSRAKDFESACHLAFTGTGKATYLSMITTLAAFAGLYWSDLDVLIEFGLVGILGLTMVYLATILIMPALMSLFEKKRGLTKPVPQDLIPHTGHTLLFRSLFFPSRRFIIIGLTLIIVMICLPILPEQFKIQFIDDLNSNKTPSSILYDQVSSAIGASLNPTLLITQSSEENSALSESIQTKLKEAQSDRLVFNNVIDLSQLTPRFQQEKKAIIARILEKYQTISVPQSDSYRKFIKETRASLAAPPMSSAEIPDRVKKYFHSPHNNNIMVAYLFPAFPRTSADAMKTYQQGVYNIGRYSPVDFIAVDGSFVSSDAITLVQEKMPGALILLILFLSCILLLTIRPSLVAMLSLFHLLAGVIITSGILYIVGIPYNILNVGCLPIVLGTGIDVFIHYSYRCQEMGSLWAALREEVPPMMMSCLTTIIGFGGLLFSSNSGLRSVGWVTVIGLSVIFLLGACVYPRVLGLIKKVSPNNLQT